MYTHPTLNTDQTKHTSDTTRRFPAGLRTFTDGSLIDREGVGTSYYDEQTKQTTYLQVDQKDILRAEFTAILRVVQDKILDPNPLQVFTASPPSGLSAGGYTAPPRCRKLTTWTSSTP
jgi:hypothetical protein